MKKILLALVLIPSLASGAGWDETVTSPQPDDTIMINDVSQPDGSKTQYTSLKQLPVSTPTTTQLDTKVGLSGDQTVGGIKNFTSSPVVPEPTTPSQAATKNYVDNNSGGGGDGVWGLITGTLSDQTDLDTALGGKVNTTGSESINGVKTFVLPPIVPTPVAVTDAVNKGYVDGLTSVVVWGGIGGTLANQTDLNAALNSKAPARTANQNYVTNDELLTLQAQSGTNTGDQDLSNLVNKTDAETIGGVKTFSSSPIVPTPTTGTQASNKAYADTKAPALTADQNYITDAEKTVIGSTSGTNTGDQDISNFVSKTGNETVQGIKSFASSPESVEPTTASQLATKAYVDANAGGSDIEVVQTVRSFVDGGSDTAVPSEVAVGDALVDKADLASPAFTTPDIGEATGTTLVLSGQVTATSYTSLADDTYRGLTLTENTADTNVANKTLNVTAGTLQWKDSAGANNPIAYRSDITVEADSGNIRMYVLDDCATATGMATGDLCFEF